MKNIIFCALLLWTSYLYAQPANDSCSNATSLIVQNPSSPTYTAGSFIGATSTTTPCSGTISTDIWYTFSALSTGVFIYMPPMSGGNIAFEILDACNGTSIACVNNSGTSASEFYQSNNFVPGQTYWVKVYLHNQASATGVPRIAVMDAPPPANDDCTAAVSLSLQNISNPTYTNGSLSGATQSTAACSGSVSTDVWYTFTAASTGARIYLPPQSGLNLAFEVLDACNGTSIACVNNGGFSVSESYYSNDFVPGQTYWVKVYLYNQSVINGNFAIGVMDVPAPVNDSCNNAIQLVPQHIMSPVYTTGTIGGATPSTAACSGSISTDVWYTFTAASTGARIYLPPRSGLNLAFEVLDACNGTSIACVNNNGLSVSESYYSNDFVPGQTYWVKVYLHNQSTYNANFDIGIVDVPAPVNDSCNNATQLFPQNTVNPIYTTGAIGGATRSTAACSGSVSTDVWYTFTATSTGARIYLPPRSGLNLAFEVLDACNGTSIACVNNNGLSVSESYYSNNFILGQTYWIKVYLHNQSTYNANFDVIVIDSSVVLANGISVQGQGGATSITVPNGTLQMEATLTPSNLSTGTVSWTIISGSNKASIAPNGLLTAMADGIVRVKGTTMDGTNLSDSIDIAISNQYIGVDRVQGDVLSVYPNPIEDYLFLQSSLSQSAYIQIVTIAGEILYSEKKELVKGSNRLNIAELELSQGVYFLSIITQEEKASYFKLVKK